MSERPLTRLSLSVLYAMRELGDDRTPNEIGAQAGAKPVTGGGRPGRGRGHRTFGNAQQIIPVLTSLRKRGLIEFGYRRDGRSGTAYSLTAAGRDLLRKRGAA